VHWTLGILRGFQAFSSLQVFPAPKQIHARPSASNANRWALASKFMYNNDAFAGE